MESAEYIAFRFIWACWTVCFKDRWLVSYSQGFDCIDISERISCSITWLFSRVWSGSFGSGTVKNALVLVPVMVRKTPMQGSLKCYLIIESLIWSDSSGKQDICRKNTNCYSARLSVMWLWPFSHRQAVGNATSQWIFILLKNGWLRCREIWTQNPLPGLLVP